ANNNDTFGGSCAGMLVTSHRALGIFRFVAGGMVARLGKMLAGVWERSRSKVFAQQPIRQRQPTRMCLAQHWGRRVFIWEKTVMVVARLRWTRGRCMPRALS